MRFQSVMAAKRPSVIPANAPARHPRAGGDPASFAGGDAERHWMPAYAGMTNDIAE